jgi:D-amino-acid dehydrogenase
MNRSREDVVIVGGGVIGLGAAYYAASAGARVVVLEKGQIGSGCSGGSAGFLGRSHVEPLPAPGVIRESLHRVFDPEGFFGIRPRPDPAFLAWLFRFWRSCRRTHFEYASHIFSELNREALGLHQDLARAGGDQYDFSQKGLLILFTNPDRMRRACERAARATAAGVTCHVLSGEEIGKEQTSLAGGIVGALHYPGEANLEPGLFLNWLAGQAAAHGATISTETEAYGFRTGRGRVKSVLTTRGEVEADQVVLASGAWLSYHGRLLGVRLPVEAGKGYGLSFRLPEQPIRRPMLLDEFHVAVSPFAHSLRVTGVLELSGLNLEIDARRIRGVYESASRHVTALRGLDPVRIWCGLRPCTPDGLPILGRLDSWRNVLVAGGHDGRGISLGPLTGKYVARLLSGEAIGDLEGKIGPVRFSC